MNDEKRLSNVVEGGGTEGRQEVAAQAHEGAGAGDGARPMGKCKHCETMIDLTPGIKGRVRTTCSQRCVKRAWKARNPEKRKEDYANNRERYKARSRQWGLENPLRKQARNRAWRINNLDRALEMERKRRIRDSAKMKAWNRHRNDVMKSASKDEKKKIAQWKSAWKALPTSTCRWCEKDFPSIELQTDHIVAIAHGGAHTLSNLCISCAPCNRAKSAQPIAKWQERIRK